MIRPLAVFLSPLLMVIYGQQAWSGPCDSALVQSTFNSFSSDHIDWRLSTLVTDKEYDKIKSEQGGDASIFGVKIGENYKDFHDRSIEKSSSYNESLTTNRYRNILWTGLDPTSSGPYSKCLESEIFSKRGLHLAVKSATSKDIAISVGWHPEGSDPATIRPEWTWDGDKSRFPKSIVQGNSLIVIPRPAEETTLAVNFNGASDSVVLEPAAKIPQLVAVPWYMQKKVQLPLKTRVHVSQVGNKCMTVDFAGIADSAIAMDCASHDLNGWTFESKIAHIEEFDISFDKGAAKALGMPPPFDPKDLSFTYYCEYKGPTPWTPRWVLPGETCGNENGLAEPRLTAFSMKLTGALAKDFELVYWCTIENPRGAALGPVVAGANCAPPNNFINGFKIQIVSRSENYHY